MGAMLELAVKKVLLEEDLRQNRVELTRARRPLASIIQRFLLLLHAYRDDC